MYPDMGESPETAAPIPGLPNHERADAKQHRSGYGHTRASPGRTLPLDGDVARSTGNPRLDPRTPAETH